MNIELSKAQLKIRDIIIDWKKSVTSGCFKFSALAGAGKTTLIASIREVLENRTRIAYVSFTGRAASVMRYKLKSRKTLNYGDVCSTIHRLIYKPKRDSDGSLIGWEKETSLVYDLIIIDEASMVSKEIFEDLSSYKIPILAVGDSFQLPPIHDKFNLMSVPDVTLSEVHRQAEKSPIITMSMRVRNMEQIPYGSHGLNVAKVQQGNPIIKQFISKSGNFLDTFILVGYNKTRVSINKSIRQAKRYVSEYPEVGERIICLKNNVEAKNCPIFNGILGTVVNSKEFDEYIDLRISIDGEEFPYIGYSSKLCFNNPSPQIPYVTGENTDVLLFDDKIQDIDIQPKQLDFFDFGFAITVFKSQGSQAKRVLLFEQRSRAWEGEMHYRWLYTAITRASEQLLLVS